MLERNPYGKVPVLDDDGLVIYESAVIDEYLEEKYPAVRLMPSDLGERKVIIPSAEKWGDRYNELIGWYNKLLLRQGV